MQDVKGVTYDFVSNPSISGRAKMELRSSAVTVPHSVYHQRSQMGNRLLKKKMLLVLVLYCELFRLPCHFLQSQTWMLSSSVNV